jgi:hypothetical protein
MFYQIVLTLLNEGIVHFVYGKCNPFVVDGDIVCNMAEEDPKIYKSHN